MTDCTNYADDTNCPKELQIYKNIRKDDLNILMVGCWGVYCWDGEVTVNSIQLVFVSICLLYCQCHIFTDDYTVISNFTIIVNGYMWYIICCCYTRQIVGLIFIGTFKLKIFT